MIYDSTQTVRIYWYTRVITVTLSLTLPSSGLLRGVKCFETDVSGLPIGPIFDSQGVQGAS
jgi:hypothetical protein